MSCFYLNSSEISFYMSKCNPKARYWSLAPIVVYIDENNPIYYNISLFMNTIPGQYRPSTAYITGPLQCVINGPITFCTSFPYKPNICCQYWPGNGPLQYGTGPVSPHTIPGQYRTGTVILYRFGTGPVTFHTGPVLAR